MSETVIDVRAATRAEHARAPGIRQQLTAIREKAAVTVADRDAEFKVVATRLAAGETVDPAEVALLLADCRKSADDLEAAVNRLRLRRVDAAAAAARWPAEAELTELVHVIQRAEAEKAAAVRAADEKLAGLYARRERLNQAVDAGHSAERRLQKSYAGPLVAVAKAAEARAQAARVAINNLQYERGQLQTLQWAIGQQPDVYKVGEAERVAARLAAIPEELARLVAEQRQAVAEWDAATMAMRQE